MKQVKEISFKNDITWKLKVPIEYDETKKYSPDRFYFMIILKILESQGLIEKIDNN